MRLRIRRLGGLAGVTLRKQFDTADLPPERASQVEDAVRDLGRHAAAQPPRPDAFRYEITQLDDPNEESMLVDDQEVPAGLRPLIEAVSKEGEIESRRSGGGRRDD